MLHEMLRTNYIGLAYNSTNRLNVLLKLLITIHVNDIAGEFEFS